MPKGPKKEPGESLTFHLDKSFREYLPRLQEFANASGLELGPAARELVKRALDAPRQPTSSSPPSGGDVVEELRSLKETVRAYEVAASLALDEVVAEHRTQFDTLREDLARVLRLAFSAFHDLTDDQVDDLMKSVFKKR